MNGLTAKNTESAKSTWAHPRTAPGARPSPGAATLEPAQALEIGNTLGCAGVAAAEDGRAPGTVRSLRLNLGPALRLSVVITLALLGTVGCRTMRPLPPANLSEPGWTVRHGQAVWHLPQGKREIAGEVLVATRTDGQSFVQFTKNPFSLVTARATPKRWSVEFPPQNKHYAGRGAPPKRVIWLYLPRVLSGKPPPRDWTWHEDASGWKLENHKNGEWLEGYFES